MTETTPSSTWPASPLGPSLQRIALNGALAAAAALTASVVAFTLAQLLDIEPSFQPMTVPAVATITVLYTMIGVGVQAVVARVATNPRRTFLRVALLALTLSFVPQIGILVSGIEVPMGEFTAKNVLVLSSLHLVAAAMALPILLRVWPR